MAGMRGGGAGSGGGGYGGKGTAGSWIGEWCRWAVWLGFEGRSVLVLVAIETESKFYPCSLTH